MVRNNGWMDGLYVCDCKYIISLSLYSGCCGVRLYMTDWTVHQSEKKLFWLFWCEVLCSTARGEMFEQVASRCDGSAVQWHFLNVSWLEDSLAPEIFCSLVSWIQSRQWWMCREQNGWLQNCRTGWEAPEAVWTSWVGTESIYSAVPVWWSGWCPMPNLGPRKWWIPEI